jgi:nickel-dependent lactate racemase
MILRGGIDGAGAVGDGELFAALRELLEERRPRSLLIIPPDYTRLHSGAGKITAMIVDILGGSCAIDVMPALGTHRPMTDGECRAFFLGRVEPRDLIVHRWREDTVRIGTVPAEFVREVSEGLVDTPIDVEVNRRIVGGGYDLIVSIGQVVPHEVAGMANYSKNIFVGCGGPSMIGASHMLGAFYGIERIMGRDLSPVRRVFDYAEEHFLKDVPLMYILTVATASADGTAIHGIYAGRKRELFEAAVADSRGHNLINTGKRLRKAVVYLDPSEFRSTWLGNKAVYRTRMAMADGGELVILAPGVECFGEDPEIDALIRKYGYCGREKVISLVRENADLAVSLSAAAHLIHGSPDGRFRVTYCPGLLGREEVEDAGYSYMPYAEAAALYPPDVLTDGFNTVGGEEVYYISNPALGLWTAE